MICLMQNLNKQKAQNYVETSGSVRVSLRFNVDVDKGKKETAITSSLFRLDVIKVYFATKKESCPSEECIVISSSLVV